MTQSSQRKSQKSAPSSVRAFTNSCILYPLYLSPTTLTPVHVRGCVIITYLAHATSCRPSAQPNSPRTTTPPNP